MHTAEIHVRSSLCSSNTNKDMKPPTVIKEGRKIDVTHHASWTGRVMPLRLQAPRRLSFSAASKAYTGGGRSGLIGGTYGQGGVMHPVQSHRTLERQLCTQLAPLQLSGSFSSAH